MKKPVTFKHTLEQMDIFLIIIILIAIIFQAVLGPNRFATLLLRSIAVAGMVFFAGYSASAHENDRGFFLKKSAVYACLFLIMGLAYQILEGFSIPGCLSAMATFRSIPRYSDLFFTITLLFFATAWIAKFSSKIISHPTISCIAVILALGISYFPENIIGYPLLGVFLGCDTYRCIALLPYSVFYLAGLHAERNKLLSNRFLLPVSFFITAGSLFLRSTALKPLALIGGSLFPVCVLSCFISRSRLCAWIVGIFDSICKLPVLLFKKVVTAFQTGGKKNLFLYTIIYTVIFVFISFFVFIVFHDNGNSFVSVKDAIAQYVPRAHYFITSFRNGLDISAFDFSLGLGRPYPYDYEPLYWLYALFNPENIESAYTFIILIRMYFAGLAVSLMLFYFKRNYYEMMFGSVMYTFCGYALYQCTRNGQFVSPMILLPLFVIAIEEIIRKKRWYVCTIVVALSMLSAYYFLYINTLAMGVYYVARFLLSKNPQIKNWKYFFQRSFTLAGTYIIGVCMGSIALFPALTTFLSSSRSGDIAIPTSSFLFYSRSWLVKCYTSFISSPNSIGYALKFGFIPLAYIAVIILFLRKENRFLKWMFAITSAFCIFPVFAYILSAFNTITHRWSYIFALVVTVITVYALPTLQTLSRRELKIIFLALLPYGVILVLDNEIRTASTLAAFAILLANYILILFMNKEFSLIRKRAGQAGLLLLGVISIWINSYYQFTEGAETTPGWYVPSGQTMDTIEDTPLYALKDLEDDSFYRVSTSEITYQTLSSSLVLGYRGIVDFSSVMIGSISDYNSLMGNSEHNLVHLDGFDNRTAMNALASVKYYSLEADEKGVVPYGYERIETTEENDKTYHIYKNKYALPLGYTYDKTITEEELENYNELEKQEILLQAVCTDSSPFAAEPDTLTASYKTLEIKDIQTDGVIIDENTLTLTQPSASVTFTFEGLENAETYLVFQGNYDPASGSSETSTNIHIETDNTLRYYKLYPDTNTYHTNQDTCLYNLGYSKNAVNRCTITFNGDSKLTEETPDVITYDSFSICAQPMDHYQEQIDNLTANVLEDVSINSTEITGQISLESDKYLVLSIPYQNGWTAYVDGKETTIEKANIMYMGFPLTKGEHTIELKYDRPGVQLAYIVTIFGFIVFFAALIIHWYRIKIRKGRNIK